MATSSEIRKREQEVDDIIASWYRAVDAGKNPKPEEWFARYPDYRAELEEFLGASERVDRYADGIDTQRVAGPRGDATPTLVHKAYEDTSRSLPFRFGDYEVLEEIARGGMGVVFKARQITLNRIVAVKMILGGRLASIADVQRFRIEAETAATLDHPNIVPIHEVGTVDGQPFFTMKYIEGSNLSAEKERFREPRRAAHLMATIARAVHHAHRHGVLHRDLKPGNILLGVVSKQHAVDSRKTQTDADRCLLTADYCPFVTDFGLAKLERQDSGLTQTGDIVGTPNYMAPEQACGSRNLTTAADVFSLGAILYELLTGCKPFQAESPLATLELVRSMEPTRPSTLSPTLDRDLETICLKCLQKEPQDRYESAEGLAEDLERWLHGDPVEARPATAWERTVKWIRRRPGVAGGVAAFIALFVVSFALITWKWIDARQANAGMKDYADKLKVEVRKSEEARKLAEKETQRAETALEESKRQKKKAEEAAQKAENARQSVSRAMDSMGQWFAYSHLIGMAEREIRAGDADTARTYLTGGPFGDDDNHPNRRLWEYRYLNCLMRGLKSREELKAGDAPVMFVAWTSKGELVSASGDGTLTVWSEGKEKHRLKTGLRIHRMVLDGAGKVYVASDDEVLAWDPADGERSTTYRGLKGKISALTFVPAHTLLVAACSDRIAAWDPAKEDAVFELKGHNDVADLASIGDILVSVSSKEAQLWYLKTRKPVKTVGLDARGGMRGLGISLGVMNGQGELRLYVPKAEALTEYDKIVFRYLSGKLRDAAVVPGYRRYLLAGERSVSIFDLSTVQVFSLHAPGLDPFVSVAASPDGNKIAAAKGNRIYVWDATPARE